MPPRFPVRRLVRLSERIPTGGESIPLAEGRPPKATWAGGASAAPEAEQDHSTVPRRRGPPLVRINDTPETSSLQLVFGFVSTFSLNVRASRMMDQCLREVRTGPVRAGWFTGIKPSGRKGR